MAMTPRYLLEGAWYALEQCGLLLGDAAILFERERYGTATCLALLAREELGKGRVLLELRRRFTPDDYLYLNLEDLPRGVLGNHVRKQAASQITASVSTDSILTERLRNVHDPEERQAVMEEWLGPAVKRAPLERADLRLAATYVDHAPNGEGWRRPADFDGNRAQRELIAANFDYSHFTQTVLVEDDTFADVREALTHWPERPPLPPPTWT